jgi:hypothetical protein
MQPVPGGLQAGHAKVGYNDELPVPGVIIKENEIFVEGIAFDAKKFHVALRVAMAGHVSLLFYREKRAGAADVLLGGFLLKRDLEGNDSGTCALAKNPRSGYGFCLRCDFFGA